MLTLVMPIAGNGKRFSIAGYTIPKPFIEVAGMTMLERSIRNMPKADKTVAIHMESHTSYFDGVNCDLSLVGLLNTTKGEACTVLKAA